MGLFRAETRSIVRRCCLLMMAVTAAIAGCADDGGVTGPDPVPAISIILSPDSTNVQQGASDTVTAVITRSGGFVGSANITIEGAPSGVTGTVFNANTVDDVTTARVAVDVGESVAAGTYNLSVSASGTGVTAANANLSLTVIAVPEYELTISPGLLAIDRGTSDSTYVLLSRTNFADGVHLTVENAPTGVTASFGATPATVDTVSLAIAVSGTVSLGDYTLTIRATADGLTDRTAQLSLSITSAFKVAFRLDDIQAYWCMTTAEEVIQVFVDEGVPLTLGLNVGDNWHGPRIDMADTTPGGMLINSVRQEPTIQFASHSYAHTNLTTLTEQEQREDFTNAQRVFDSFDVAPVGFVPPENAYNATTISLMQEFGLNLLSAQCTWSSDQQPVPITCGENDRDPDQPVDGVTYVPVGAVLGENSWDDINSPMSWAVAESWATRQFNAQEFAVFMMHPREFTSDGTCGVDSGDAGKLATLNTILDQAKLDWTILSFEEMAEYIVSR